jgi:hypothetical protein
MHMRVCVFEIEKMSSEFSFIVVLYVLQFKGNVCFWDLQSRILNELRTHPYY